MDENQNIGRIIMDSQKLNNLLEEWDGIQEQILDLQPIAITAKTNESYKILYRQLDQLKACRASLRIQIADCVAENRPGLWG